jgi:hypothetical protein
MGEVAATKSGGIARWAQIRNENSERDVHRVVKKQRTSLNIPIDEMNVRGKSLPWINPRAWLEYIVSHGLLYMLSGLQFENRHLVETYWTEFWARYETLNPDYGLFDIDTIDRADYGRVIGLFIHGDEGRTLKKQGLMVTSIQSVLGSGFSSKRLKRPAGANDAGKLHVNFAGHTFLTRFVLSVIHKVDYQSNAEVFHDAMDVVAESLRDLLHTGIVDRLTGKTWRFAVVGVKGDMPYLQKMGRLKRSWNTTVKRGNQRTAPKGVCHLCLAGTNQCPAEDTADRAVWFNTIGVQVPWDTTPGVVRLLPHPRAHPGSFFQADLWHCVHLGIGKSFIASVIQLALETVPATNNDDRFQWLTDHYHRWCRSVKASSHVSKISAYLVSHGDGPGATGNWSKGGLTTNLARWLVKLLGDIPSDANGFLPRAKEAMKQLNAALSFLYNAPLFLERSECRFVCCRGMYFVQTYTALARDCFGLGKAHLFPLFPKIHAVQHVWLQIELQCDNHGFAMNPLTASCQMDEDIIGKVSRVSRRVNARSMVRRTLQRHLMSSWHIWFEAGVLR